MKRRWDFDPPPYYYPPMNYPPSPMMSVQQAMEAKEWWEKLEKTLKKDTNGKDKKSTFQQGISALQCFLLLVGTSPFVALIYKFAIIPALIK